MANETPRFRATSTVPVLTNFISSYSYDSSKLSKGQKVWFLMALILIFPNSFIWWPLWYNIKPHHLLLIWLTIKSVSSRYNSFFPTSGAEIASASWMIFILKQLLFLSTSSPLLPCSRPSIPSFNPETVPPPMVRIQTERVDYGSVMLFQEKIWQLEKSVRIGIFQRVSLLLLI